MTGGAFERSARRRLRAYPLWWREHRGEEMLSLLEELADDGAQRVDLRTGLGLVRGGWATRWRHRPPAHRVVLYRLGLLRLPARYHWWAARDIQGALYPVREISPLLAMYLFLLVLPHLWGPGRASTPWVALALGVALTVLPLLPPMARLLRRLGWERAFSSPGASGVHGARPGRVEQVRARRRMGAHPALGRAVLVLAFGVVILPAASALAPQQITAIPCQVEGAQWCAESAVVPRAPGVGMALAVSLALAVLAGALLGRLAARRVRRADLPAQPHRHLAAARAPWGSVAVTGVLAALGVAEATGALVQLFSAPVAAGCVVGLGVVLGQRVGLRGRPDAREWAVVDAWRATFSRSSELLVDAPRFEAVVPTMPPELAGPAGGAVAG